MTRGQLDEEQPRVLRVLPLAAASEPGVAARARPSGEQRARLSAGVQVAMAQGLEPFALTGLGAGHLIRTAS